MRMKTVGTATMIAGLAIFIFTFIRLVNGSALDHQTKVPGTFSVEIDEPGRFYVWDNHWTVFDGERIQYEADCPDDAKISVRDASSSAMPFVQDRSKSWSIGNSGKTSIGYIDVSNATTLELAFDDVGRERIVTVSNRTMKQELWARLGGLGIGLGIGILGILIFAMGFLRRRIPAKADSLAMNHGG